MGFLQKSAYALGRLLIVGILAGTFVFGMFGVIYLQLKGEEVKIPKVVGKNFNDGIDELALHGLRIRKIASRYSEEKPNTILEQRPRAGSTAKTGLMISVVVSQEKPDGTEAPADVKDDEEVIEEIEELPELKTDKSKKKSKAKSKEANDKTRDVIDENSAKPGKTGSDEQPGTDTPGDSKTNTKLPGEPKTGADKKTDPGAGNPKTDKPNQKDSKSEKPKTSGETRPRTSPDN